MKIISKYYGCKVFPITLIEQWAKMVGNRKWEPGKSAHELAKSWFDAQDIPAEIRRILKGKFGDVKMQVAFVEYNVYLDTKKAPSCSDIMVYAKANKKNIVIAVEGKFNEGFKESVGKWLNSKETRQNRLKFLCEILNLKKIDDEICKIKYQLLHRTASVILEARKNGCKNAILLVHSFSPENKHFEDFQDFGKIFGVKKMIEPNTLYFSKKIKGINLYILWYNSNCL